MAQPIFAKRWDYKLRIRRFFEVLPSLPAAADTIATGRLVAEQIVALADRIGDAYGDLGAELRECADDFTDLDGIESDFEARDRFNSALDSLYDTADRGKRVWIE